MPDHTDLTICTVSFHSKPWLDLNWEIDSFICLPRVLISIYFHMRKSYFLHAILYRLSIAFMLLSGVSCAQFSHSHALSHYDLNRDSTISQFSLRVSGSESALDSEDSMASPLTTSRQNIPVISFKWNF